MLDILLFLARSLCPILFALLGIGDWDGWNTGVWGTWWYSKLPFESAEDGISYTFSITPNTLGKEQETRVANLVSMLDGFFSQTGHHINVNVFDRSLLQDAMKHPEKYPQLTIRVSGYAVKFTSLTREQQLDVINRTIHEKI